MHLPASGVHEAVEVEPLVAPAKARQRSASAGRPQPPYHGLQPQPHLVLGPRLDLGVRMGLSDLPQPLGKLVLKASCSETSASELEGRGTCGV